MPDSICIKCGEPLNEVVISACGRLNCPNKEPVNTSGKVGQLFVVGGNGFEVDGAQVFPEGNTP